VPETTFLLDIPMTAAIIAIVAVGLAVAALIWAFLLQRRLAAMDRMRRQIAASATPDIETLLQSNLTGLTDVNERLDALAVGRVATLEASLADLIQRQKRDLQHVGIVRFNPYQDTGGDQSFSLALLDAYGDGIVISGLFARGAPRLFAKPIQGGTSTYPLSDEEKQALAKAQGTTSH